MRHAVATGLPTGIIRATPGWRPASGRAAIRYPLLGRIGISGVIWGALTGRSAVAVV